MHIDSKRLTNLYFLLLHSGAIGRRSSATRPTPSFGGHRTDAGPLILLELTCCAEEGVKAAQLRKQVRYHELVENINATNWNASLLTIEVGARGLIGNGTFRAFTKPSANNHFSLQDSFGRCRTLFVCDMPRSRQRSVVPQ